MSNLIIDAAALAARNEILKIAEANNIVLAPRRVLSQLTLIVKRELPEVFNSLHGNSLTKLVYEDFKNCSVCGVSYIGKAKKTCSYNCANKSKQCSRPLSDKQLDNVIQTTERNKKEKARAEHQKYNDTNLSRSEKQKITLMKNHGVTSTWKLQRTKDAIKRAFIDKYGVTCPSHVQEILKKRHLTRIERGTAFDPEKMTNVESGQTLTEYMDLIGLKQKSTRTHLRRHGIKWVHETSKLEKELLAFVEKTCEHDVLHNDRSAIAPLELDVYIPELNLAFEFNGVYWHSEQQMTKKGKSAKEIKFYHQKKTKLCAKKGIRLVHIFEDHWQCTTKRPIIESIIKLALGVPDAILGARDCSVELLSASESMKFQRNNHLYNPRGAEVHIGLKHTDSEQIVAVMTFGRSKFNKHFGWELLRYAPVLNTSINGAAQKLWKHFVKMYKPRSVICYADASLFTGSLYEELGFVNEGITGPNNWYIINGRRFHRMGFTKNKMIAKGFKVDDSLSAHQNMLLNNNLCVWDSGSHKLTWSYVK